MVSEVAVGPLFELPSSNPVKKSCHSFEMAFSSSFQVAYIASRYAAFHPFTEGAMVIGMCLPEGVFWGFIWLISPFLCASWLRRILAEWGSPVHLYARALEHRDRVNVYGYYATWCDVFSHRTEKLLERF